MNWENLGTAVVFVLILCGLWLLWSFSSLVWRKILGLCGGKKKVAVPVTVFLLMFVIPGIWFAAKDQVQDKISSTSDSDWILFTTLPPGGKGELRSTTKGLVVRDVWATGSNTVTGTPKCYSGASFAIEIWVRKDTINGDVTFTPM